MVGQAGSVPDLLRSLMLVQMQVHGVRKAVISEARAVGYGDKEIAALMRITVEDFRSRYPT